MYRVREMGQVRQQKYGETGRRKVYRVREMGEVVQQKYGETGRRKVYRVREMGEVFSRSMVRQGDGRCTESER